MNDEGKIPTAPRGIRQHDFTLGYRACEATMEDTFEALGRATALAEEYGEAIIKISAALAEGTPGGVNKARMVIAGLDSRLHAVYHVPGDYPGSPEPLVPPLNQEQAP